MSNALTLRNIDSLELNRIYKVGNLKIFKDTDKPNFVWSKYSQEESWHPFYKTDDFFIKIQDIPLEKTSIQMH